MRKILTAFLIVGCLISAPIKAETWSECAHRIEDDLLKTKTNKELMSEICSFYNKPFNECVQIFLNSTPEQQHSICFGYLYNVHFVPKCGAYPEAK